MSDAAAFSFFTNKNMTTAEGGMMIVRDPDRRQRARLLRAHGMTASTLDRDRGRAVGYDVVECGHNFRMDELRGALGLVQLERLPAWNETRRELMARYRTALARDTPEVGLPFDAGHPTSGHIMPVLLPAGTDRAAVMASMRAAGVQTSVHYPAIHQFDYYRRTFGSPSLPATEQFSRRELTLPLHPALSPEDVDRVVAALRKALDSPPPANDLTRHELPERTSDVDPSLQDFSDRTVLVVGGAGYVGSVLVPRLLAAGAQVRVLDQLIYDNGFALAPLLDHPRLRFQRGDLRRPDDLAQAAQGATDVVLLASLVGDPICKTYPELAVEINEDGAKGIIDRLDEFGVGRFVFTSTCSNYGIHTSDRLATEESELNPQSLYARTKIAVEEYLLAPSPVRRPVRRPCCGSRRPTDSRRGCASTSRCPSSPGSWPPVRRCRSTTPTPGGPTATSRDISKAIMTVLTAPEQQVRGEVFNVGDTGQQFTKRMIVDEVLQAPGRRLGQLRGGRHRPAQLPGVVREDRAAARLPLRSHGAGVPEHAGAGAAGRCLPRCQRQPAVRQLRGPASGSGSPLVFRFGTLGLGATALSHARCERKCRSHQWS